jgi:hypothetical protein
MKKSKLLLIKRTLILTALVTLVFSACKKDETETRTYSFTISRNSSALANSSVTIQTREQDYSVTTDGDGKCKINIPNTVSLPSFTIVTIDHSSIKPYCLSVSGASNANSNLPINCTNVPTIVRLREVALHHLGDGNFTGSENSQLQLSSEGIQKEFHYNLAAKPSIMPHIQIFARGIQSTPAIFINGHPVGSLTPSPTNGDLGYFDFQLQTGGVPTNQIFNVGDNVLKIHTTQDGTDWDDIEFCGLLLYYP